LVQMSQDETIASLIAISDSGGDSVGDSVGDSGGDSEGSSKGDPEGISKSASKSKYNILMATNKGMIKKTEIVEFKNAKHTGIVAIGLAEGDRLVSALAVKSGKDIVVATKNGYASRFVETEVRAMGRSAQGVKGVSLEKGDAIVGIALVEKGITLLTVTERGYGKRSKTSEYPKKKRGGKGVITLKATAKTGKVIGVKMVSKDDEVIMISNKGKFLRLKAKGVPVQGRNTQGVKLMNLDKEERLTGVAVLAEKEDKDEAKE